MTNSKMKLISLSLAILFMLNAAVNAQERFTKYPKIEGYEVRPGIFMIPRYSAANEVCEIGLEKLHYTPDLIRLDSELSQMEIFQVLDELVPANERGTPVKGFDNLVTIRGSGWTQYEEYENVSIRIYAAVAQSNPKHKKEIGAVTQVVATVTWKNRKCR